MLILVGSEKGGVGKTTIACNIAVALARQNRDVLLVDADKQASASHWADQRSRDLPALTCMQKTGDLFDAVQSMSRRFDDVIVDAGGRDSAELRSAMLVAELAIVPFRASQLDLWTMDHVADLLRKAGAMNRSLRAVAVLNMAPTHAKASEPAAAREMLAELEGLELATAVLHDRKAYRDAVVEGCGVLELGDAKAAHEVDALVREVTDGGEEALVQPLA